MTHDSDNGDSSYIILAVQKAISTSSVELGVEMLLLYHHEFRTSLCCIPVEIFASV